MSLVGPVHATGPLKVKDHEAVLKLAASYSIPTSNGTAAGCTTAAALTFALKLGSWPAAAAVAGASVTAPWVAKLIASVKVAKQVVAGFTLTPCARVATQLWLVEAWPWAAAPPGFALAGVAASTAPSSVT